MHVDFSVELGAEDDCLELPWASPDGALRYYDLRRQPELLEPPKAAAELLVQQHVGRAEAVDFRIRIIFGAHANAAIAAAWFWVE